jgi:hypothetical protein
MSENILSTQVRMPKDLYEELRVLSFVKRTSINQVMVSALKDYVKTNGVQVTIKTKE